MAHRTVAALEKASAPLETLTADVNSLWRQEIEQDFRAEETVLFPPARALGTCRDEIEQFLQEHQRLRELVRVIKGVASHRITAPNGSMDHLSQARLIDERAFPFRAAHGRQDVFGPLAGRRSVDILND